MKTVAIAGVGLIGASLGLALREAGFAGRIVGVSSPASIDAGCRIGAIDEGAPLEQAAAEADLIYLSQPIQAIRRTIETLAQVARPQALITDAGSTKVRICEAAALHLAQHAFLGGHPMAGKEQRGAAAAEAGLFRGRPYILTPTHPNQLREAPYAEFAGWLEKMGVRIVVLSPQQHDRLVAFTSHLPQLLATTLAASLGARPEWAQLQQVAGPGLQDMTRLARSPYEIWQEILATNHTEVVRALDVFLERASSLRDSLLSESTRELFEDAQRAAAALKDPGATT